MKTKAEKVIFTVLLAAVLIFFGIATLIISDEAKQPESEMQTYELQLPSVDEVVDWYEKQEQEEPEEMPKRDTQFEGNKL